MSLSDENEINNRELGPPHTKQRCASGTLAKNNNIFFPVKF
jgi:hypothetical protein